MLLLTNELGDFLITILNAMACSVLSLVMKFLLHEWNLRLSPSQRGSPKEVKATVKGRHLLSSWLEAFIHNMNLRNGSQAFLS